MGDDRSDCVFGWLFRREGAMSLNEAVLRVVVIKGTPVEINAIPVEALRNWLKGSLRPRSYANLVRNGTIDDLLAELEGL